MYEQEKWELANARRRHRLDDGTSGLFPSFAGTTMPVARARIAALRLFLLGKLGMMEPVEADAVVTTPVEPTPGGEAPTIALHDLPVGSVCAKCRGSCCQQGGNHAYLTSDTLARAARYFGTADGIVDRYLALVPRRSYAGSCIFHATTGCGLPRALRSDTCNRYLCPALKTLAATAVEAPGKTYHAVFERPHGGTRVYRVDNFVVREERAAPDADECA